MNGIFVIQLHNLKNWFHPIIAVQGVRIMSENTPQDVQDSETNEDEDTWHECETEPVNAGDSSECDAHVASSEVPINDKEVVDDKDRKNLNPEQNKGSIVDPDTINLYREALAKILEDKISNVGKEIHKEEVPPMQEKGRFLHLFIWVG